MKLTWIGHSCFRLEEDGFTILFDPYEDGSVPGLAPVREEADLVLCSHDHFDHNAADLVTLRTGGTNPFSITEIPTYHDEKQGALRGLNVIRLLEKDGRKIVHFGDIGCDLTEEQKEMLSGADLVMIPVGGYFTVDADMAAHIVQSIEAKTVIPMHFRDRSFGFDVIAPVDDFLRLFRNVERNGCSISWDGQQEKGTVIRVLTPQNLQ